MIHYVGWERLGKLSRLKGWLFHIWNDYEPWHRGIVWDGVRLFGFNFENLEPIREKVKEIND